MPHIKLGVMAPLSEGPEEALQKVADFGFLSCQVVCWDDTLFTDAIADRLAATASRLGIEITTIWTGAPGRYVWNFIEGPTTIGLVPPENRVQRVVVLKRGADFARRVGAPSITTHVGFIPENPSDPAYLGVVEAIREVAQHCRANELEFWFETGQETPITLLRTIEDVGTGNLGINLDPANLLLYGKANPVDALDVFGKYVRGVHAKDGEYPTDGRNLGVEKSLGEGRVNFPTLIARLKGLDFGGALTIEREISGPQQIEDIRRGKQFLEELLRIEVWIWQHNTLGYCALGIIGVGFMGRHHIAQWEKLQGIEIVAIADPDPIRLHNKATVGGNINLPEPATDFSRLEKYDDGRALIAQADVDFVDICTPSDLHAEMAVLAAGAGRHILVEKPMALSSADAARMVSAAHAANINLMVAQVVRFWPEYLYLRETVASGQLGKMMSAEFVRRGARPRWSWRKWMSDVERSGGAIFDLHVHDVDFVNYLLGSPCEVQAAGVRSAEPTGHDLIAARYTYHDGLSVTVDGGWYAPANCGFYARYEAVFEQGIVRYHGGTQPTLTVMRNDSDIIETPEVSGDPYAAEITYFARCLLEGRSPAEQHLPESSLASLRLVEAEVQSLISRKPVRL